MGISQLDVAYPLVRVITTRNLLKRNRALVKRFSGTRGVSFTTATKKKGEVDEKKSKDPQTMNYRISDLYI